MLNKSTLCGGIGPVFVLSMLVGEAHVVAKARTIIERVENIEAIVTHVDLSENPGDADWNITIRAPSKSLEDPATKRFWQAFWTYYHRAWKEALGPLVAAAGAKRPGFSDACRRCAGDGATGTRCQITGDEDEMPCPALFGCAPCLYDLNRLNPDRYYTSGDELADFSPKAEIFFGVSSQDLNDNLNVAMRKLGFGSRSQSGAVCSELRWTDRGRWEAGTSPESPCGKRIWLSGHSAADGPHDDRPEVHPVSSIILERQRSETNAVLGLGAFIDGSQVPPIMSSPLTSGDWTQPFVISVVGTVVEILLDVVAINWSANYREMLGAALPSVIDINLESLHPPRPATRGSSAVVYHPRCVLSEESTYRRMGRPEVIPISDPVRRACDGRRVTLDRASETGAAWVATAKIGWRRANYAFDLGASLETEHGALGTEPPSGASRLATFFAPRFRR